MRPRFLDRIGIDDRFAAFMLALSLLIGCEIPTPQPPGPTPPPVVITTGLRVLIVRETADRLPASQQAIFTSAPLRKLIRDSKAALRVWDDDVDAANESDAEFRKLLEMPRSALPWLVVAGGSKTISAPLPLTVDETATLIRGAQ